MDMWVGWDSASDGARWWSGGVGVGDDPWMHHRVSLGGRVLEWIWVLVAGGALGLVMTREGTCDIVHLWWEGEVPDPVDGWGGVGDILEDARAGLAALRFLGLCVLTGRGYHCICSRRCTQVLSFNNIALIPSRRLIEHPASSISRVYLP